MCQTGFRLTWLTVVRQLKLIVMYVPTGIRSLESHKVLLFLIYINDFFTCSDNVSFYLFADDTSLLHADKNLQSLEVVVNNE